MPRVLRADCKKGAARLEVRGHCEGAPSLLPPEAAHPVRTSPARPQGVRSFFLVFFRPTRRRQRPVSVDAAAASHAEIRVWVAGRWQWARGRFHAHARSHNPKGRPRCLTESPWQVLHLASLAAPLCALAAVATRCCAGAPFHPKPASTLSHARSPRAAREGAARRGGRQPAQMRARGRRRAPRAAAARLALTAAAAMMLCACAAGALCRGWARWPARRLLRFTHCARSLLCLTPKRGPSARHAPTQTPTLCVRHATLAGVPLLFGTRARHSPRRGSALVLPLLEATQTSRRVRAAQRLLRVLRALPGGASGRGRSDTSPGGSKNIGT